MRFALIGQPNCGKSTLFNQVAGYKAQTGNFAGTTVSYTESRVRVLGEVVEIVDLPGTYTLEGTNPAEREVLNYLASREVDAVINVLDATHLFHGLALTIELLELGRPLVIAVNMMDEAVRMGVRIDGPKLEELLGAPVLPLVASRGRGVRDVFVTALNVARSQHIPPRPNYARDVEEAIQSIAAGIDGQFAPLRGEAMAAMLLEGDAHFTQRVSSELPELLPVAREAQEHILNVRGQDAARVLAAERHALAASLAEKVVERHEHRPTLRDRLDDVLLHPIFGYVALIAILYLFFQGVYGFGSLVERPILAFFDNLEKWLVPLIGGENLVGALAAGLLQGISGGVAIVLPYLVPFLVGLGLLEDVGYLPRMAFLMDSLMHRLGLHGKAIVPFILGYGCNVPAIMSTRILDDPRERLLAATLSTLVPCAARLSVVFGLVAFYLGPNIALAIYLFNLFVIAVTGRILSRMIPEDTPGLIMEIPVYRTPTLRNVLAKAWFRVHDFVVEAWPVLIAGSAVLALLTYLNLTPYFNLMLRPISWLLGLPSQVGVPLIFGILRKELSLIMLRQALGGASFAAALTPVQMITFSVFVVFYIPCLATLSALRRELGGKAMLGIAGLTVLIASLAALIARGVASLVL